VKAHRGSAMRKMEAQSLAALVIMAARLRSPRQARVPDSTVSCRLTEQLLAGPMVCFAQ